MRPQDKIPERHVFKEKLDYMLEFVIHFRLNNQKN